MLCEGLDNKNVLGCFDTITCDMALLYSCAGKAAQQPTHDDFWRQLARARGAQFFARRRGGSGGSAHVSYEAVFSLLI